VNPSPPETAPIQSEDRTLRIVVLTARRAEYISALQNGPANYSKKLTQNHPYYAIDQNDYQFRITHLGVGPEQAKKTLEKITSVLEGDLLIVAGTAGSLHADLTEETPFIPTALAHTSSNDWFYPDTQLLHWIAGVLSENDESDPPIRMGPMVTSPRPVLETEQRNYLSEKTGAMAVDMESSLAVEKFRHTDDEEGQWLGVRVISDSVEEQSESTVEHKQEQATELVNHQLRLIVEHLTSST